MSLKDAGNSAFKAGEYKRAAAIFSRALANDEPEPAVLQSNLSAALRLSGDLAGALHAAEACMQLRPKWSKAHFRCGEVLLALSVAGSEKRGEQIKRLMSICPSDQETEPTSSVPLTRDSSPKVQTVTRKSRRGEAEGTRGAAWYSRPAEAAHHLQLAATLEPKPNASILQKLDEARRLAGGANGGSAAAAKKEEEEEEELSLSTPGALAQQSDLAQKSGSQLLVSMIEEGCKLMREGALDQAIAMFVNCSHAVPQCYQAHANIGVCYHMMGQDLDAIPWFERAVSVKPDFAGGYRKLGISFEVTAQLEEAEAAYRKCIKLDPTDIQTQSDLVIMLGTKQGRVREALAHIQTVPGFQRHGFLAYYFGYLLLLLGPENTPTARTVLQQALAGNSAWPSCCYLLAFACRLMQDNEAAETYEGRFAATRDEYREQFHGDMCTVNNKLDMPQWALLDDKVELNRLMSASAATHERFVPRGYVMPEELPALQAHARSHPEAHWILKRHIAHGGTGNRLLLSLDDVPLDKMKSHVVQRYIHNPMLIDGLKFHLRLYVVVLHTCPVPCAYLCTDGLMLFAVEKYQPPGLGGYDSDEDYHRHITNQGFNSKHAKYQLPTAQGGNGGGGMIDGHTRNLKTLRHECEKRGADYTVLWRRMQDTVVHTLKAAADHLQTPHRDTQPAKHARLLMPKVLGYDLLLDEELNPWLMEINRAPALGHRLEVDQRIKTSVLRDGWTLALTLRPHVPYSPSAAEEIMEAAPMKYGCLERLDFAAEYWTPSRVVNFAQEKDLIQQMQASLTTRGRMDDIDDDDDDE